MIHQEKVRLSLRERFRITGLLTMWYIEGIDSQNLPVYAFGSLLGHRSLQFLERLKTGQPMDLGNFGFNVAEKGLGQASDKVWADMLERYLVAHDYVNVRIFPGESKSEWPVQDDLDLGPVLYLQRITHCELCLFAAFGFDGEGGLIRSLAEKFYRFNTKPKPLVYSYKGE